MRAGAIWMSHLDTTGWAADRMCFAVNAEDANDAGNPLDKTPQMVLQANGNVGIGTTDPRSKFQVSMGEGDIWTTGTTVADCHMLIGGNEWGGSGTNETLKIGLGYFGSATSNIPMYIGCRIIDSGSNTTSALVFGTRSDNQPSTATEERMCILPSGNVGIGTADPPVKFAVKEGGDAKMAIIAGQEYNDAILYFGTPYQGSVSNAMKAAIIAEGISSWSRSKLHFCLDNTGDNSTTYNASLSNSRMTITEAGNVGIGTTSPHTSYKLDAWSY